MDKERVLLIEDEPEMLNTLREILEEGSLQIVSEQAAENALQRLEREPFDLIVTDIKMGRIDGIQVLNRAREVDSDLPVILITAYPEINSAVNALRQGAFDYLIKPFEPDELRLSVMRALQGRRLRKENRLLKRHFQHEYKVREFIGRSAPIKELLRQLELIAKTSTTVLITGESGTGKELVARVIHDLSHCPGNFVPIDCAAIPASLIEGELFGYERGAYTGAVTSMPGLFELADDGTIFLDEICELPLELQTKLLRVIEEKKFRRLGARTLREVKCRIIAATNRDIQQEVREGRFREDLYFRLHVVHFQIPPLRERKEDISLLVEYYLKKYSSQLEKPISKVSKEVWELFLDYPWPGNVRELQNVIKRALIFCEDEVIKLEDLPEEMFDSNWTPKFTQGNFFSLRQEVIENFEKEYFVNLLKKFRGNVNLVAKEAKVPLGTVYRILKKLDISPLQFRE